MKAETIYYWESEDPSRDFAIEAYNLLLNFWDGNNTTDIAAMAPFRRAVLGNAFTASDISGVCDLLETLADRALARAEAYGQTRIALPQGPGEIQAEDLPDADLRATELRRNAASAQAAAIRFRTMFLEAGGVFLRS